tara:strand:- start:757 stop:1245 length:489 start_codon:yes stop_codon:yes gene_type:complete
MAFDTITVTPTLDTSAYSDNDVLFVSTAVKLPHRNCKVTAIDAVIADTAGANTDSILFFFKEDTNELGTINATADITGAQMAANVLLGTVRLVSSGETSLGTPTLLKGQHINDIDAVISGMDNIVLTEGSTKNTCYIQALYEGGAAGTYAADALVITISVEY